VTGAAASSAVGGMTMAGVTSWAASSGGVSGVMDFAGAFFAAAFWVVFFAGAFFAGAFFAAAFFAGVPAGVAASPVPVPEPGAVPESVLPASVGAAGLVGFSLGVSLMGISFVGGHLGRP
jgi:hypothetical protein